MSKRAGVVLQGSAATAREAVNMVASSANRIAAFLVMAACIGSSRVVTLFHASVAVECTWVHFGGALSLRMCGRSQLHRRSGLEMRNCASELKAGTTAVFVAAPWSKRTSAFSRPDTPEVCQKFLALEI